MTALFFFLLTFNFFLVLKNTLAFYSEGCLLI